MSIVAERIDETIKLEFAGLLRENDFKKSGRTWHALDGDSWLIVNVQASTSNLGDEGKFTVNLGVYSQAIATLAGQAVHNGKPKEYESTIRTRLGSLAYGKDHWWVISPQSDLPVISRDIVDNMASFGLPWLRSHKTIAQLSETLKNSPSLLSFSAALLAEGKDEAERRLKAGLELRPAAKSNFTYWAKQNGILL